MQWEFLLTAAAVFVALITAILTIVKTFIDNKAKRRDAERLFRYTKLFEILIRLQEAEGEKSNNETEFWGKEYNRSTNILICYTLAKPLLATKYWNDMDNILKNISNQKIRIINELVNKTTPSGLPLLELNGKGRDLFISTIQSQMVDLLN